VGATALASAACLGAWLGAGRAPAVLDGLTAAGAVGASNRFGFDLYARAKSRDQNLICSPASAAVALTMTLAGARGSTQAQMAGVLHLDASKAADAHASFASLLATLNGRDGHSGVALHLGDRLWGHVGYTFRPEFLTLLAERYRAPLEVVDFGAPEAARATINRWGAVETHGRITEVLPPRAVTLRTRLVLTNSVYFKGRWATPFVDTHDGAFTTAHGEVTAKMMSVTERFAYARVGDVQIVQLPYAGGLSMVVVLPGAPDGLEAAEARAAGAYDDWVSALRPARVDVKLPRWKLDSTMSLKDQLTAMGMPIAFTEQADFSGMTGKPGLFIGGVLQQAFVEVNEVGTEAAAVTAVIMEGESAPAATEPPVAFYADHPFLYLIRDDATGTILFMGRVVDPTHG
jgi:serpin B